MLFECEEFFHDTAEICATVNTTEGAAYGAALLAGVGAGFWPDGETACRETVRVTGSTTPDADAVAVYEKAYGVYRGLYPALKGTFERLSMGDSE